MYVLVPSVELAPAFVASYRKLRIGAAELAKSMYVCMYVGLNGSVLASIVTYVGI